MDTFYESVSGGQIERQPKIEDKRKPYGVLAFVLIALAVLLTFGFVSAKYFLPEKNSEEEKKSDIGFHGTLTLDGKDVQIDLDVQGLTINDVVTMYQKYQNGEKTNG